MRDPKHDPKHDPQPGDVIESFNDFLGISVTRTVILREGCKVTFLVGESVYSICVDLWKVMNSGGTVISKV